MQGFVTQVTTHLVYDSMSPGAYAAGYLGARFMLPDLRRVERASASEWFDPAARGRKPTGERARVSECTDAQHH